MEDIIGKFIGFMSSVGISPHSISDIKGDDKRRNFRTTEDNQKKKSGFYKLRIYNDFGFGYVGNYKTDESYSFCSKSSKVYSKEEIAAFKLKAESELQAVKDERQRIYNEKAKETQDYLFFLENCNDHPYLKKKGLGAGYGAKHSGQNLVLPIGDFDKYWNYQRITPDGEKLFYEGARKSGLWFAIEGDLDLIYICEGFATGASVHMATDKTVLVAFDGGNLIHVVKNVLSQYPEAKLVIAADNDHETKINGKLRNVGLEKANQINAVYPNIKVVYPEFKEPAGKTDFNDLFVAEGIAEVTAQLAGKKKEPQKELVKKDQLKVLEPDNENWRDRLIVAKNGIDQRSTINASLILAHDEAVSNIFRYDSFSKQILLMRCPPWMNDSDFKVRAVQDQDYIPLECWFEENWRLKVPKNKCADLIMSVAMRPENTFNPAKDYFEGLIWDGTPRLHNWLKSYVSDGKQPDEYLSLVGTKIVCGLAARAMYPGCKFDTMVIFEGEQYAGKSFLSRYMGTIHGEEYFLDDFKDIENKDALMKMQGKLVVEFPEISTMRKAEVNDLKAFITRQTDEFRPPYGRNVMVAPRQCIFIGTVNPEGPYFKDMTGNRRYWPVSCRRRLALKELKMIMPQLHAEAANRVKNGEQLWLDENEYQLAQIEQDKRVSFDLWIDKIEEIVIGRDCITTDDLLSGLKIEIDKRNPMIFTRIHQIMASIGWKAGRVREGGKQKRGFKSMNIEVDSTDIVEEIKW